MTRNALKVWRNVEMIRANPKENVRAFRSSFRHVQDVEWMNLLFELLVLNVIKFLYDEVPTSHFHIE